VHLQGARLLVYPVCCLEQQSDVSLLQGLSTCSFEALIQQCMTYIIVQRCVQASFAIKGLQRQVWSLVMECLKYEAPAEMQMRVRKATRWP